MHILHENKPVNLFVHLCIERCIHVYVGGGVVMHVSHYVNTCVLVYKVSDAEFVYEFVRVGVVIQHLCV